jgi:hypothetical protein
MEALINVQTGEIVYQEMGDAEYGIYLADRKAEENKQLENAKAESKAEADKTALLAKLGITADEAKLLLS